MNKSYQEISDLLSAYEELFADHPDQALKKMIDLYPSADEVFNHEIADAIELWVHENINNELVVYLQNKIGENKNLNRVYTNWINSMNVTGQNYNALKELVEKINHGYDGLIHSIKVDHSLKEAEVIILVSNPDIKGQWMYVTFHIQSLKEFTISQKSNMSHVVLSPYGMQVSYYSHYLYIDFAPREDEPPTLKYTLLSPIYFCCESISWEIEDYKE